MKLSREVRGVFEYVAALEEEFMDHACSCDVLDRRSDVPAVG